jgi:sugar lactone lactonase YvrE
MFSTSPTQRRISLSQAHRSTRRPQLERLEDRVVPSIADGTILLLDNPTTPTGPPTALVGVNPHTGAQSIISKGQLFVTPLDPREAADGQIYVTDYQAYAPPNPTTNVGGAVFRVDPNTGRQSLVAKGGYINGASGLAVIHHKLYITDIGDDTGTYRNIVEIDPETGKQRLVSKDGMLYNPLAIVPGPDDNLFVLDEHALANAAGTAAGALFEINIATGRQTLVATNAGMGGKLVFPIDLAQDPSGNLIIFNRDSATDFTVGAGGVLRLNPHTGTITIVSDTHQGNLLSSLDGGAVARDGTIYAGTVTTTEPTFVAARIITVNPVTGAQHILSEGKNLDAVEGLTVYYRPEEDDNGPPDGPSPAPPLKQPRLDDADVEPEATLAVGIELWRIQPAQLSAQAVTMWAPDKDSGANQSAAVTPGETARITAVDSLFANLLEAWLSTG